MAARRVSAGGLERHLVDKHGMGYGICRGASRKSMRLVHRMAHTSPRVARHLDHAHPLSELVV